MLQTKSAKLTNSSGPNSWSQVHEFQPDDPDKLQIRGKLFLIAATTTDENRSDTLTLGRELIARINEEYYGNLEDDAYKALKTSIEKVSQEFYTNWGGVELGAIVVLDKVIFAAASGGCGIWLYRAGTLASLVPGLRNSISTASGFPKPNDVFLMATKSFFNVIPLGIIKAAMGGSTPQESVETLAPIIHGKPNTSMVCAQVIQIKNLQNSEEFKIPTPQIQSNPAGNDQILKKPLFNSIVLRDSLHKIFGKVSNYKGAIFRTLPAREIYIKEALIDDVSPRSKKLSFVIALSLLFVLFLSIVVGFRQKQKNDLRNKYTGILQEAGNEVDQAISLASISSERSRELFVAAQNKLNEVEKMNVKDESLDELRKKIEDARASILGEYNNEPELFSDLTLLSSGFNGDQLVLTGKQMYVFDKAGSRILGVEISSKKSKLLAGPGALSSPESIAGYEDRVFVNQPDGIYEVESTPVKKIFNTWSGPVLFNVFGGNVYVLDKNSGQIYRYQSSGNGFSEKQNWLTSGVTTNLADTLQTAIDGSVYVLFPNSKILKFSQGNPQTFSLRGMVPDIGNTNAISAGPDNQYIYLLDTSGKRVVVVDKRGTYKAQYRSESIGNAKNIVADEKTGKIILLTGDKLYFLPMKHL